MKCYWANEPVIQRTLSSGLFLDDVIQILMQPSDVNFAGKKNIFYYDC